VERRYALAEVTAVIGKIAFEMPICSREVQLDRGIVKDPLTPLVGVGDIKNAVSFLENTCLVRFQLGGGNRVISTEESGIE